MIKKINLKNGIVRHFWGKSISFTDGINVIYGPNGTGKTVLLNTISHFTFIQEKGWTKPVTFNEVGFLSSGIYDFDVIAHLNKKCEYGEAQLDWDGIPVFKTQGILPKKHSNRIISEIMCGCKNKEDISYEDLKKIHKENLSNGQTANLYIQNLLNMEVPDIASKKSKSRWSREYENIVADYVSTLPMDGKPTILIDEIDGFLDFDNLHQFWTSSIFELAKKYQIIIVTHNPFFINDTDFNIIGKDYYEKSLSLLSKTISA